MLPLIQLFLFHLSGHLDHHGLYVLSILEVRVSPGTLWVQLSQGIPSLHCFQISLLLRLHLPSLRALLDPSGQVAPCDPSHQHLHEIPGVQHDPENQLVLGFLFVQPLPWSLGSWRADRRAWNLPPDERPGPLGVVGVQAAQALQAALGFLALHQNLQILLSPAFLCVPGLP